MKVSLLSYTNNPERLAATAARTCYSAMPPEEIYKSLSEDKIKDMIHRLNETGHATPLEHSYFTFAIDDISLPAAEQMLRYRIATFDKMSMRSVNVESHNAVIPPSILATKNDASSIILTPEGTRQPTPYEVYTKLEETSRNAYKYMISKGIPKEDARYGLITGTKTQMVMTMNVVQLRHMFAQRCCIRAQHEIRSLANMIVAIVQKLFPDLFDGAGSACEQLGYCPEASMCCGKAPTLKQLLDSYYQKNKGEETI